MKAKTIKREGPNSVNNILGVLAVVVVCIAVFNLFITFSKISEFNKVVTGYATASSYVNITVNTNIIVSLGPSVINWGNGTVNVSAGCYNASLITYGAGSNVTCGNWSNSTVTGINISNTGNVNCSLNISGVKNYTQLFGSSATGGFNYSWNVTMKDANSCNGGLNNSLIGTWTIRRGVMDANTSLNYCANFGTVPSANEMWLDVYLRVPYDLNTTQQNTPLSDTITVSCI